MFSVPDTTIFFPRIKKTDFAQNWNIMCIGAFRWSSAKIRTISTPIAV
jgi:hypothetical protein